LDWRRNDQLFEPNYKSLHEFKMSPSKTVLIANRGEIACRVIRSAKSLGLRTVAVYSEADAGARHTRMADHAVYIGPAHATKSYLLGDNIIEAAQATNATIIHPGYGFLSENADFASLCARVGLTFVGPRPDTIATMGDKERARRIACEAGLPVGRGTETVDASNQAAVISAANLVGYPLLIKAAAGGGGIGMRPVHAADQIMASIVATSNMAERAFGNGAVYLEKMIERARHLEVQIFGFGNEAIHLFDRDCSIQRRYQKLVEEAGAPNVPDHVRREMSDAAVRLARACQYIGAGTVEFLYDDETEKFFFMEMNTRLQVEHPVTENLTGLDIVALQLRQALGEDLSAELQQEKLVAKGHSIELRVCAENPERKFMPCPGVLTNLVLPKGPGVRVDSGFDAGDRISSYYDSLIMKIVAYGSDRASAIHVLIDALDNTVIEGVTTNLSFLRNVLEHPLYRSGKLHTRFVEDHISDLVPLQHDKVSSVRAARPQ
jgi:3-methylcrotonyl-CoA carboxylase alpha subunit